MILLQSEVEAMAEVPTQTVTVAVGQQVQLTLPSRGSAGFGWIVTEEGDKGAIAVSRAAGARPPLPPPGSPPPSSYSLDEIVTVTGIHAGTVILDARLARPAGDAAPIDRRRFRVEVAAP